MTQLEICEILADLAYEEHMKQESNVTKEAMDCPYYNVEKEISEGEK